MALFGLCEFYLYFINLGVIFGEKFAEFEVKFKKIQPNSN